MIPWLLQLPPKGFTASPSVTAAPPLTETFFSFPPAKKPTHWPSGEKNGALAPSVPGIGLASRLSIERK